MCRKLSFFIVLSALLSLIFSLFPAVIESPSSSASAESEPTIAIASDAISVGTDAGTTVTATAGQPLNSEQNVQIWRTSPTPQLIKTCMNVVCSSTVSLASQALRTSKFSAFLVDGAPNSVPTNFVAETEEITLNRAAFSASLDAAENNVSTDTQTLLTAQTNQTVSGTGLRVIIYNRTTNQILKSCNAGSSCSVPSNVHTEKAHDIVAYVATSMDGSLSTTSTLPDNPVDLEATSPLATIVRNDYSVSLTTNKPIIQTSESATLTVSANQNVANSAYRILLYNRTSGTIVGSCLTKTCSYPIAVKNADSNNFIAFIAKNVDGKTGGQAAEAPTDLQASSDEVIVNRAAWSVALEIEKTEALVEEMVKITATTNQPVDGTGHRIFIFDRTAGNIIGICTGGKTCVNPTDLKAESNQVSRTRPDYKVSLTVDKISVDTHEEFTLTANTNQFTYWQGYKLYIYNRTTGTIVADCSLINSTVCQTVLFNSTSDKLDYVAYVAKSIDGEVNSNGYSFIDDNPIELQAKSKSVQITGKPFELSFFNKGENTLGISVNRQFHATSYRPNLNVYIYDRSRGTVVEVCVNQQDCLSKNIDLTPRSVGAYGAPVAPDYVAYLAYSIADFRGLGLWPQNLAEEPVNLKASHRYNTGESFSTPPGQGYVGNHLKASSIGTASPNLCVCEAGDPVNLNSGHLTESAVDFANPAAGFALSHSRNYNSSMGSRNSAQGKGWGHQWGSNLASSSNDETVVINFDDWSKEEWTLEDGVYTTDSYSHSALKKKDNGEWLLTRADGEKWTFTEDGRLLRTEDPLGNYLQGTYSAGKITQVTNASGANFTYTYNGSLISSVTSPGGKTVSYSYNGNDELTTVTYPDNSTIEYDYDANGRIVELANRNGNTVINEYDSEGRVIKQEDQEGGITSFDYDTDLTVITYPSGLKEKKVFGGGQLLMDVKGHGTEKARVWSYTYDPLTRAISTVTDPTGNVEKFTYDSNGRKISHTNYADKTETWTYNDDGVLTSSTGFDGVTKNLAVNEAGLITSASVEVNGSNVTNSMTYKAGNVPGLVEEITNGEGETSSVDYDARGLPIGGTSPGGAQTKTFYNADGAMVRQVDPYGLLPGASEADHDVNYTLDAEGRILEIENQEGSASKFTYDAQGNVLTKTDATNLTITYTYDALDRMTSVTTPDSLTTTFVYDADGNLASSRDSDNNETQYSYNIFGEQVSVETPEGRTIEVSYDNLGRPLKVTNGVGGEETYTYNVLSQPLTITGATGGVTEYAYDSNGRVTTVEAPDGSKDTYTYDALDNVTSVTKADSSKVETTYDSEGRVTSVKDANGKVSSYEYNDKGLPSKAADAAGRETRYTYDIAGLPTKVTAEDGSETTFVYEKVGRLLQKNYSDQTPDVSYTYDNAGRRLSMTDGSGVTNYVYDSAGRLTKVTDGDQKVVQYTYNSVGEIASIVYPDGSEVTHSYDNDGLLASVTDDDDEATSFQYDSLGALASITYPNGIKQDLLRTTAGEITDVEVLDGTAPLATWDYDVSASGQVSSLADSLAASTTSFAYSNTSRMTGGVGGTYGYDAAGNITGLPSGDTLEYDAVDQLTAKKNGAGAVLADYGFDVRGNRIEETAGGNTRTFNWDAENRLTSTTDGAEEYSYSYDGDGYRVSESLGTADKEFVWNKLMGDGELLTDGSHNYIYGPNGIPIQQVKISNEEKTFLHLDRVGSVRLTTDAAGDVVGQASFDSYGKLVGSDTTESEFGFAGEYADATGLIYLRARYYDPSTAQFISADPLEAQTMQRYSYAGGDPFLFADPSGLLFGPIDSAASFMGKKIGSGAQSIANRAEASWSATSSFVAEHKGTIVKVGTVVATVGSMAACTAVTAGGCLVLTIAVTAGTSALDYSVNAECFTPGGLAKQVGIDSVLSVTPLRGLKAGKAAQNLPKQKLTGSPAKSDAAVCSFNSFSANTLVLMADGSRKRIKDLREGDLVKAKSEDGKHLAGKPVTDLIRSHKDQKWVDLELSNGETLEATDGHPFWEPELKKWIDAGALKVGSQVELVDSTRVQVTAVKAWTGLERAYNLTVADYHTYYVGDSDVWVHNCNGTNRKGETTSRGSWRNHTLAKAWEGATLGPNKGRLCPTCGIEVKVPPKTGKARDWDASHNPSWTNRSFPEGVTRKEVLDNYNEGVSLECPGCNRSGGNNDLRFGK